MNTPPVHTLTSSPRTLSLIRRECAASATLDRPLCAWYIGSSHCSPGPARLDAGGGQRGQPLAGVGGQGLQLGAPTLPSDIVDDDVKVLWACSFCTFYSSDQDLWCAMCERSPASANPASAHGSSQLTSSHHSYTLCSPPSSSSGFPLQHQASANPAIANGSSQPTSSHHSYSLCAPPCSMSLQSIAGPTSKAYKQPSLPPLMAAFIQKLQAEIGVAADSTTSMADQTWV